MNDKLSFRELYDMDMHETIRFDEDRKNGRLLRGKAVLRVPGGVIYRDYYSGEVTSTFVSLFTKDNLPVDG